MENLYLDMKYIGRSHDVFKMDATEISHHCGQNLGNFVFRHALRNVLADLHDYKPVEGAWSGPAGQPRRVSGPSRGTRPV